MTSMTTRLRRVPRRLWLAALPLALLAACGGGDEPVAEPGTPPPGLPGDPGGPAAPPAFAVASLNPADGSTGASTTTTLAIQYTRALDFSEVSAASLSLTDIVRSATVALNSFTRNGTAGYSIATSSELALATRYQIDFRPVRSAEGDTLPATSTTFSTRDGSWGASVIASVRETGLAEQPVYGASRPGNAIVLYQRPAGGGYYSLHANPFDAVSQAWSPNEATLFDGTRQLSHHALAVSPTGFAVAVWVRDVPGMGGHLFASTLDLRAGNSTWTAAVRVDTADAPISSLPTVAIDRNGNVLAAWVQPEPGESAHIHARFYNRAADTWDPVARQPSAMGSHDAPTRIAFDDAGNAYLLWTESNSVQWARRQAGGTWEPAASAIEVAGCAMNEPGIALNDAGSGVLYGNCRSGQALPHVWVRDVVAGAAVGTPVSLDGPAGDVQTITASVNAGGQAALAWVRSDPVGLDFVQTAMRGGVTGTWSIPRDLRPADPLAAEPVDAPSAVIDEHGNAMVAWSQPAGDNQAFRARYNALTGTWAAVEPFPGVSRRPVLRVDALGRITAVWESYGVNVGLLRSAVFR
jgi:hypothetical protein